MMTQDNYCSDSGCHCLDDGFDSFGNPDNLFGSKKKKEKKHQAAIIKMSNAGIATIKNPNIIQLLSGKAAANKAEKRSGQVAAIADKNYNSATSYAESMRKNQEAANLMSNPNVSTSGQMGTEAGATTMNSSQAATQSGGGGGGDIGSDSTSDITDTGSGGGLSTADNPKVEAGVTVKSKKTNWIMIGLIVAIVIVAVVFIIKSSKNK